MKLIDSLKNAFNKNVNVIIGKPETHDASLFGGEDYLYYEDASIGRILIDTGLAKSWSEYGS